MTSCLENCYGPFRRASVYAGCISTQAELCCPNGYTLESEGSPTISHLRHISTLQSLSVGTRLYRSQESQSGRAKLLEAVIRTDLSSADWYVLQKTATTDLLFRLLRLDVEKGLEPQAFLAVSYRCPDETWTRTPVCREASVPEFYHHLTCALLCSRDSST